MRHGKESMGDPENASSHKPPEAMILKRKKEIDTM